MNFDHTQCRLALRDEDGFVRCQPDPYGSEGTAQSYEAFLPFGLGGRPKAPTNGIGAHVFVMRHGDDTFVLPGHDPRWMGVRPDFGDGGAPLVACTGSASAPKAPYVAFFGEGAAGGEPEGLFRILAKTAAGDATVEINPTSGNITITHPSGTKAIVKASGVELGGEGGFHVLVDNGVLTAYFATIESRFTSLGQNGSAPTGYAATKAKAT